MLPATCSTAPAAKPTNRTGTFTFDKEDIDGSNPKFDVVDQDGVQWRVKMGAEARPETVASRLVWGAGYFANEDYFMPVLHVQNMKHLRRGRNLVSEDGTVHDVRLKRHSPDEKKIGIWSWSKNPFTGTPEWYGLRVLMAVMNNWDLKDMNNSIYLTGGEPAEERYLVSDLGASFGSTGLNWALKGKPSAYCDSKWIKSVSGVRRLQHPFCPRRELLPQFSGNGAADQSPLAGQPHPPRPCPMDGHTSWRGCRPARFAMLSAPQATLRRKSNNSARCWNGESMSCRNCKLPVLEYASA